MSIYEPIMPSAAWPESFTFSPGVRAGNWVFLSGTTATDERGRMVGPGDIAEQTRQIYRKFAAVLAAAGGGLENIVETTDYVLSLDDYKRTADVRREFFKGPPWPAATGVVVSGLVRADALIEIKGIAFLPDK
jgi:enamine deaminase RidA (YjgF/YER057c/UK114 family)